ncbi:MAG: hypothetical protein H7Z19_21405 [Chitinophagaceae bacterium]|nr:hypothetical protein [Rubrivivax sp.]
MPVPGGRALRCAQRWLLASGLAVLAGVSVEQPLKFLERFASEQQIAAPDCLALRWSQKPGDSYGRTEAQLADSVLQWSINFTVVEL